MLRNTLRIVLSLILATTMVCTVADDAYAKKKSTRTTRTTKSKASSSRSSSSIRNEKRRTEKEIAETRTKINENRQRTQARLDELNNINSQIQRQESTINDLNILINDLQDKSNAISDTIEVIEKSIGIITADVAASLRNAHILRYSMNPVSFLFSSSNYDEAQRRLNYLRQFERARNKKVAELAEKHDILSARRAQLDSVAQRRSTALTELSTAKSILASRKQESARVVADLKREGADLNKVLAEKRRKAKQLDDELNRIIAQEQQSYESSDKAKKKSKAKTKKDKTSSGKADEYRTLTGSFESNKGRLLFPVAGRYSIVGNFGRSQHNELDHVQVDNSGIDIAVAPGTKARAVFEGTVSSIFFMDGYENIVMIRHGSYVTVYAGLSNITVKKGQKVKTGATIGTIATIDGRTVLHFEVRKERTKLNPLQWVK